LNLDINFIIKTITELIKSKQQNINFTENKIRFVQASLNETKNTLYHIVENQEKLEQNIIFLQEQIGINAEHIDQILIKTKLLEQVVLFDIMLNQYAYEMQNLIGLINSAISGNIYIFIQMYLLPIN